MAVTTDPNKKIEGGESGEGLPPKKEPDGGAPPISEEDEIIPVRKSSLHNQQGYAMRKRQEAERLKSAITTPPAEVKDDDEDDPDGEELTPEAKKGISKEIARHIEPLRETILKRTDEEELQQLLSQEPDAKEYESSIRKYMDSKAYRDVPPSVIFHHLAFDKAETTGARRRKAADLESEQSRAGGHTRRPIPKENNVPTGEEIDTMDDKEFAELEHRVRIGKFVS